MITPKLCAQVELLRKTSEEALGDACGPERVLEQRIARSEAAAKEAASRADQAETKVLSLATSLEECQTALSKARASSQRARRDEEAGASLSSSSCTIVHFHLCVAPLL